MTRWMRPAVLAGGLALIIAACDQPLAVATGPSPLAAPPVRTDEDVARETLARLVAQDGGPEGRALLPKKLALMGRIAALVSAPSGSADARMLDGMVSRLHALSARQPKSDRR